MKHLKKNVGKIPQKKLTVSHRAYSDTHKSKKEWYSHLLTRLAKDMRDFLLHLTLRVTRSPKWDDKNPGKSKEKRHFKLNTLLQKIRCNGGFYFFKKNNPLGLKFIQNMFNI